MKALDPRPARRSRKSLAALALLVPLAAGLVAAGGGAALMVGVLIPLGALGVLALAAGRRGGPTLFTWQQVHMGMERELRRSLRRRRWRRRLHLGAPSRGTGSPVEKTSA